MNTTEIYLGHALTDAPDQFRQEMFQLRAELNRIPDVRVLEFNWLPGRGPDLSTNTHRHDSSMVGRAQLMVAVADYPSLGLGAELQMRLESLRPLLVFLKREKNLSQYFVDMIKDQCEQLAKISSRETASVNVDPHRDIRGPIPYENLEEIVGHVSHWIDARYKTAVMS